ncbi:MAG: hypothetical protein HOM51_07635 [Rhodospirillaceae bacterium]|nr:hypothetical protein [Rhodospirillaceae bacterium]
MQIEDSFGVLKRAFEYLRLHYPHRHCGTDKRLDRMFNPAFKRYRPATPPYLGTDGPVTLMLQRNATA